MNKPVDPHDPGAGRFGRYRARHTKKKAPARTTGRKVLLGVNIVVATSLVLAGSAFGYAEWRLHEIRRVHIHSLTAVGHDSQSTKVATAKSSAGPPETILLVGSDSRAALKGTASAGQYGSATQVSGARSDTIILVRLVPATKQIEMLSIPRDLWLPIAGLGHQKINAALGVSPDLLISTIQSQLGIDVNHYVDIDFQSFKDISNAIGGVSVYFPTPVRDAEETNFKIPAAGCVSLVGDEALAFVRSRMYQYYLDGSWHQEGESDLARIQRQQLFIRKMVGKAERTGLGNPLTLNAIIGGITKNLTVDDSFSVTAMLNLAQTFRSVNPASIQGVTLPTYPETLPGPNDVLMPQTQQDKAVIQQFLSFGETPTTTPPSTLPVLGSTTTSTLPPTTVAASSVAVHVYNGSGVSGQAGAAASALRSAGFDVLSVGTASSYNHPSTIIQYSPGEQAAAATLQARIGGGATLEQVSGLGTSLDLITGQSYSGVVPAGSARTGATTTTTSTTVPATTTTTYALPGSPATGAPSCD
ncbi:LCP family protein [Acidiferrimicrobium sp. IK]|uniref:LCP family protein n=1 Tax=Acidiferrimicrobium sp. IK TaxID=2871700 RepID=UPI0021CB5164|nr:LCP family protein [Acidiferrimicrobium sp. IK]MCU4184363.1 LCP family protein [Acidiferrimicrobium sp. IK]